MIRVTGMPFGVKVWMDDGPDEFLLYMDEEVITERGAAALGQILNLAAATWTRGDEEFPQRMLRAVTG
ncbi:hypothetical protein [Streptomyces sp. UH6]|uniref:hypothetical protein n=1 Tax=Streptomyces sp. UH6 TaxID=2748379 RepID=UPI0015D4B5F3|nr:hypothetical protein [Streptomyces sp. UH6]NYV73100.1 hypothetical protein [Streptomyces sp. UH6]